MAKYKNAIMQSDSENKIILWNPEIQNVVAVPASTELLKELQLSTKVNVEDSNQHATVHDIVAVPNSTEILTELQLTTEVNVEDTNQYATAASWKDNYAAKKLIHLWKTNQPLFKSSKIRNDVVWRQIAKELQKYNPNCIYTGSQCENKFKDIRKNYVKVKDHNANSTGGERKTCKFYEEMEEVLGDKPCIKPLAIASTLRKRPANDSLMLSSPSASSTFTTSDEDEIQEKEPPRRRSRIDKSLQDWAMVMRQDSQRKEMEKERRHKEKLEKQEKAIITYQELMTKLLDKL